MRAIMRRLCAAIMFAALAVAAAPASAREVVSFEMPGYSAGTIVVRTSERRLYLVVGDGQAIRYPVGVGRAGKQWAGRPTSTASTSARPGRRRPTSSATIRACPTSSRAARAQSDGRRGAHAGGGEYAIHGTNAAELDRRLCVVRLHPHVQPGHHRFVRAGRRRHGGGGDAVKPGACAPLHRLRGRGRAKRKRRRSKKEDDQKSLAIPFFSQSS